jgi:hypothetical protein
MRVMGKGFHADAFANFAGLEPRHVLSILSALSDHDCLPDRRTGVDRRASRLPDDWTAPDEWIQWAVDKRRWEPQDAQDEAEIFANYWQAKSGQQATKTDWFKTWQNWVKQSRRPDGTYRPPVGPIVSNRERMAATADLYERLGRTSEAREIRAALIPEDNVIPFNRGDEKIAV